MAIAAKKKQSVGTTTVSIQTYSMLELSKELTRYSETDNLKNYKKWTLDYVKNNKMDDLFTNLSKLKDCYFQTIGVLCHLLDQGHTLPDKYDFDYMKSKLSSLLECEQNDAVACIENKSAAVETSKCSKKDVHTVVAESLLAVIDRALNSFLKHKQFLNVPSVVLSAHKKELDILYAWCGTQWKNELTYLSYAEDKESEFHSHYDEAYSNLTPEQKNQIKIFYSTMLKKIESTKQDQFDITSLTPVKRQRTNTDNTNKVKTKKQIIIEKKKEIFSKEKMLKTFLYKKVHEDLISFDPKEIFRSKEIYILDTKYNKILYLKTEETFQVKGRSIINFNIEESGAKLIPKKIYDSLLYSVKNNVSSTVLSKIFKSITNNKTTITGRISEEMILLKKY